MDGVEPGQRAPAHLREKAVEAVRNGATMREAAALVGAHPSTVSIWCRQEGDVVVKRTHMLAVATDTLMVEAADRRARLSLRLVEAAEEMHGRLFSPTTYFHFDKEGNVHEHQTSEPSHQDKRYLATALGQLIRSSIDVENAQRGSAQAAGIIEELVVNIRRELRTDQEVGGV